uniref:T-cell differentiation antigen CD6 n=1 Tax=Jaculus jaculus TaxID=51337 RepID=A0A8C5KTT9_JACJA
MWLFLGITGLLTPTLSGLLSPAPLGQHDNSSAKNEPLGPGELLGVRLVNGSSRCSGSVEVWLRASWEPACAALWSPLAAEAVCHALGCGEAGTAAWPLPTSPELQAAPTAGNASRSVNVSWPRAPAVLCTGTDWRLCEAVEHECSSSPRPARVTCAERRALRLVDGGSPCAGRVELLEYGQWGTVCDDAWDLQDASVVCQQLRCGWAVQALPGLHFAPGQGPIHRDQVNCSGAEAYLWDCPGLPGDQYCGHKEDAGVVCSEHQSWRLTGGLDACEGQVEVHFRGVWSTVCDSTWYQPEAEVLCQSLGCGSAVDWPRGLPHSLAGRMYYSCEGKESSLSACSWRFNNSNLCSQSLAARVLCSGSRRLHNLSLLEVPGRVTVGSSVTVTLKDKELPELTLLIPSIVLGILLLASLVFIAILLLRVKGRYALFDRGAQQQLPTAVPAGINSYHAVPITMPKEEVLTLPIQAWPPAPKDSDSSSDSDYEHYDFSSQPPVALTTFYNSHRHRVTEEEIQQGRFQMPPLEEGLEELHISYVPAADPRPCIADAPPLGPQCQAQSSSGSSTSSAEDYCNSPNSKLPSWNPQMSSSQRNANLELAGYQATFSGTSADDSSSTSSGEWYQNLQPPPQLSTAGHSECPEPPDLQPESTSEEDYDDIGAA